MPDINFRLTATDEATPVIDRLRNKMDGFNRSYSAPMGGGGKGGELPAYRPNYDSKLDTLIGDFFGTFQQMLPAGMKNAMPTAEMTEGATGAASEGAAAKGAAGGAMAGMGIMMLAGTIKSGMDKIGDYTQKIWQITVEATPQLKSTIQWIYDVLALSLYPIGQAIAQAIEPIAEMITDISTELLVKFGDVNIKDTEELANYFAEVFKKYVDFAAALITKIAPPILVALIKASIDAFLIVVEDYGNKLIKGIGPLLGGIFNEAFSTISDDIYLKIVEIVDKLKNHLLMELPKDLAYVMGVIKSMLVAEVEKTIVNLPSIIYKMIIGGLAKLPTMLADIPRVIWNELVSTLKKLSVDIPLIGTVGLFQDLKYMASGGIVTKPTLAMIGERGAEAVIPLNKSGFGMSQGVTVQVNGNIYGVDDLERAISDAISRSQMGYASYR